MRGGTYHGSGAGLVGSRRRGIPLRGLGRGHVPCGAGGGVPCGASRGVGWASGGEPRVHRGVHGVYGGVGWVGALQKREKISTSTFSSRAMVATSERPSAWSG